MIDAKREVLGLEPCNYIWSGDQTQQNFPSRFLELTVRAITQHLTSWDDGCVNGIGLCDINSSCRPMDLGVIASYSARYGAIVWASYNWPANCKYTLCLSFFKKNEISAHIASHLACSSLWLLLGLDPVNLFAVAAESNRTVKIKYAPFDSQGRFLPRYIIGIGCKCHRIVQYCNSFHLQETRPIL